MKKLLIAMTAAAIGTCAWAAVEVADATLLNENFNKPAEGWSPSSWTVAEDGKVSAVAAPWSYAGGTDVGDGELTLENNALTLNTGSKVLNGKFASEAVTIPDTNVFFNATVTFKDPSDTLPELTASDKFALVVLDNVDSLETGTDVAPATNLWVIAGYGTEGKRAYKLSVADTGDNAVDLDASWFKLSHTIVVKAYADAIKDNAVTRAGFLVMVDTYLCKVMSAYEVTADGRINYDSAVDGAGGNYLGLANDAIADDLQERYADQYLIIANDYSGTLTSVDFQGQGTIDDVSLAATSNAAFGEDVTVKKLTFTYAEGSATATTIAVKDGDAISGNVFTIPNDAEENDEFVFVVTVSENYKLTAEGAVVAVGTAPNTFELTYTYDGSTSDSVEIDVFMPAAEVDGGASYKTIGEAIADANGGTVNLKSDITLAQLVAISGSVTIDLKGNDIVIGANSPVFNITSTGELTIKDTIGGGRIANADSTFTTHVIQCAGILNVQNGIFDGWIKTTGAGSVSITGGKFLVAANETLAGVDTTKYTATNDGNGYWVVAPASTSNYPESDKLVNSETELTADQKKAVEATFKAIAGEATDKDAAVTNYINTVYGATVPADALIGAKSVDISVKFNLPLMKTETPTIEVAPATVTADSGNAAAFEFTIKDGDTALTLSQVAKVLEMVQYVADLANDWAAATAADVDTSVNAGKAKVELKAKTGVNKGFMRLKLR